MKSLLLTATAKYMLPGMLLFSFFLLLRGHNLPGGGFSGGLVAAASFSLYGLAYGKKGIATILRFHPISITAAGLLLAVVSGLPALFKGQFYLTAVWFELIKVGDNVIKVGTPLVFDIGVYLVVIGGVMTVVLALEED